MNPDIQAEILGWVLDEVRKQSFGEQFGGAVTWGPIDRQTPGFMLLLRTRSPLAGQQLGHMASIGDGGIPSEDEVRAAVTEGMRLLRDLASSQLGKSNGHTAMTPRR